MRCGTLSHDSVCDINPLKFKTGQKEMKPFFSNVCHTHRIHKMRNKGLFTYYVSQKRGFVDPPPSVSKCQLLADPPSPPCQLLSAIGWPPLPPSSVFGKRPICTTNFTEEFLKLQHGRYSFVWVQFASNLALPNVKGKKKKNYINSSLNPQF